MTSCTSTHIATYHRLLAALPHAIGFPPTESLVLAWLAHGTLVLTQRVDLPPPTPDARVGDLELQARALIPPAAVEESDLLIAVIVTERHEHVPAWTRLAERIVTLVHEAGVCAGGVLQLTGGRWRCLDDTDPRCCRPAGRAIDPRAVAGAAADAALRGRTVLPDRAAMQAQVAPDPSAVAQVRAALPTRPRRPRQGDRWRDAAIQDIADHLLGRPGPDDPARRARILRALADTRVRDTVLWDIAHASPDAVERAAVALAVLTRSAPPVLVAPVATCCAVAFWLTGDGATAGEAVERALSAEPAYGLAVLVSTALRAGWPPSRWRDIVAELDRATCRRGLLPPAA